MVQIVPMHDMEKYVPLNIAPHINKSIICCPLKKIIINKVNDAKLKIHRWFLNNCCHLILMCFWDKLALSFKLSFYYEKQNNSYLYVNSSRFKTSDLTLLWNILAPGSKSVVMYLLLRQDNPGSVYSGYNYVHIWTTKHTKYVICSATWTFLCWI